MTEPTTPLMRQYQAVKAQVPGALLLFRLGDFYELFYEDAITAARELEITLTARNKERGEPVPMCGVPYHSADNYISRLIQRGYRVAICEQMEEPGPGKKLVRRELTRVITPGTATESTLLRSHENNYLAAAFTKGDRAGLAYVDVSTGEFRTTEVDTAELIPALETLNVREVLHPEDHPLGAPCLETAVDPWIFGGDYAGRQIVENFGLLSLDGCGLADKPLATAAAGAVLHYLRETQKSTLGHLSVPSFHERRDHMVLDAATVRNLELVEPLFAGESRQATLISVLDQTCTGMGGRLLRRRLLNPCCDLGEIDSRLDAVAELTSKVITRADLRKVLGSIQDLERLLARITLNTASPRDLLALGRSLEELPKLGTVAHALDSAVLRKEIDTLDELCSHILAAISDEPPINPAEPGIIRDGFNSELDELRDIGRNSRQYIAAIEARERART
ncbi:MAG: DNA mismatch repair protein MutS, partial [Acidobacteriaceae bacterium]|nr:DNA mismatch repair protein MutS [Acidobacteriaceae bacterium]